MIDRSEVSCALAKAIAFKQCGNDAAGAAILVATLECEGILRPELNPAQLVSERA